MGLEKSGIKYFGIKELVHPHVYNAYGEERAIHFLDLRVFRAWDWIREQRGNPIYMNTWGINRGSYPEFDDRGLRWRGKSDTGSLTSQHYFGRAGDGDELGTPASELYQWVLDHQEKIMEFGVTTLESIEFTKTWVHLDCRSLGYIPSQLKIVTP